MSQQTPNPGMPNQPVGPTQPVVPTQPVDPQAPYAAQPIQQVVPQQPYAQQPYSQQPYPQQPYQQPYQQQPHTGPYPTPGYGPPVQGKSSKNVLLIVIAAVAVLAIIGCVALVVTGNRGADPVAIPTTEPTLPPAPTPGEPTLAPKEPTASPVPEPIDEPEPQPQPEQSDPSAISLDLGYGIVTILADGWDILESDEHYFALNATNAVMFLQALEMEAGSEPKSVCQAVQKSLLGDAANVEQGPAENLDVSLEPVGVAGCASTYTQTQGGKSESRNLTSFASVRKSDGLTVVGSVITVKGTSEEVITQAIEMFFTAVATQAAG